MTTKEMMDLIAPHKDHVEKVINWLLHDGKISRSQIELNPTQDFISVRDVPIQNINKLLEISLQPFQNTLRPDAPRLFRESERHYTVPSSIAPLIDYIGSIHSFPKTISNFEKLSTSIPLGDAPKVSFVVFKTSHHLSYRVFFFCAPKLIYL